MKHNSMRPILSAQFMLSLILIYTGCGISVPQPEMLPSQLSGPSDTSRRVMLFIPPSVKETKAVWEFPYRGTTRTMTVIVGSPFARLLTQGIKNRFPNLKVTRNVPISGSYDLLLTPDLDTRIQGNRQGDAASVDLYITSNLHIQDSYKQVDTVTGQGRGNAGAANLWKVSKSGRMFSSSASGDMVVGMQLSSIGKRAGDQALSQDQIKKKDQLWNGAIGFLIQTTLR